MSVIHDDMFDVHGTMMMIHIAFALKHNTNVTKCSTLRYNTCGGYTMLYGTTGDRSLAIFRIAIYESERSGEIHHGLTTRYLAAEGVVRAQNRRGESSRSNQLQVRNYSESSSFSRRSWAKYRVTRLS